MRDSYRLLTFCLVLLSCQIPCAISVVRGLYSALTIDDCGPSEFCSIRNNSTVSVRFYFWSTVGWPLVHSVVQFNGKFVDIVFCSRQHQQLNNMHATCPPITILNVFKLVYGKHYAR
ncbi:hypothetical protein PHET_10831 [Paragonimus heterotremus]|uniref:Secreted protein n=1 Tax=Paragonimus heterotremus TaxID=100268 RepID=A0A8J4T1E4_9TREM|nr:hypothetical protein PHET_10831 [Paragonimus heterotremus]